MNFLKKLFGGKKESSEEKRKAEEAKNFDILKYDGIRALKAGQDGYAVKCLKHALELKDDLEVRDYLSVALISNNEMLPAYEQLQKLAEVQPDNQQIFIRMANVTYMMEDYQAMASACEKATLIDNSRPEVAFLYAKACIGLDDTTNAIALLTKAISLNKDYADAYLLRGETLLKNGNIEEAGEDTDCLLELVADNEDVLMLKARVERAKGCKDEAVKYLDKVAEVNPFCIEAYRERADLKKELGDEQGAKEDIDKLLEIAPQDGEDSGIEKKVGDAYKKMDPYGIFS